jgi:hypothetical protein
MKKVRMIVSAFAVFAIVGSALAFAPYGQGSVYCDSDNSCTTRVSFRVQSGGTATPCQTGITPHVLVSANNCQPSSGPFVSTTPGK